MSATFLLEPKFFNGQIVSFIGGEGVINNYRFGSGNWEYLVQMPMGPEPEMGRVGYETMIWLSEVDTAVCNQMRYTTRELNIKILFLPPASCPLPPASKPINLYLMQMKTAVYIHW